jgi:hypothetical protein
MRKGDWMQTASGRQFWPLDPQPGEVAIDDIAHALSLLCRFGGHCRRFYSVAEHSVLLARAAEPEHKRWALMHDSPEAYVMDLIRPLKRDIPGYKEHEARVLQAISVRFNLFFGIPAAVKLLDSRILMDERAQNMESPPVPWEIEVEPLGVQLQFWTPEQAKREFLAAYAEYFGAS